MPLLSSAAFCNASREDLLQAIALARRQPAQHSYWIRGQDTVRRHIEVVAFPLINPVAQHLGAIALFFER